MLKNILSRIVVLFSVLVLFQGVVTGSIAADWCPPPKNVNIKIVPNMANISYDFSKSFVDLSKVKINHNPYGAKDITHTFGLANGQFQVSHGVKFQMITNPNVNQSCIWYDSIDVKMKMDPKILIAKEYRKGGCHHKKVMAHEKEHIEVDKVVTNKYAQKLGQALSREVMSKPLYGPFSSSQLQVKQREMQDRLSVIVKANNDEMMAERSRLQALVDSRENYDTISKYLREVCDRRSPMTAKRVQKKIY